MSAASAVQGPTAHLQILSKVLGPEYPGIAGILACVKCFILTGDFGVLANSTQKHPMGQNPSQDLFAEKR